MNRAIAIILMVYTSAMLFACGEGGGNTTEETIQPLRFASCTDLKQYLYNTAIDGKTLLDIYDTSYTDDAGSLDSTPTADTAEDTSGTSGNKDYSNTNVQEQGVDEPDFVKTDGTYIYIVSGGKFIILNAWPASNTSQLSEYDIEGYPVSMFAYGNTALIFSSVYDFASDAVEADFSPSTYSGVLKITVLDISNRSVPALIRETYFEGSFSDARMVGGKVHVVLNSWLDIYGYISSLPGFTGGGTITITPDTGTGGTDMPAEPTITYGEGGSEDGDSFDYEDITVPALSVVAQSVEDIEIEEIFPRYYDIAYAGGTSSPQISIVCACDSVYKPIEPSGTSVTTLFSIDLNAPLSLPQSVSILGNSGIVYGSEESIYIASVNSGYWLWWPVAAEGASAPAPKTDIYKFTLNPSPAYAATGEVEGWLLNQFSMSEYQGYLRVATSYTDFWAGNDAKNSVYVLNQDGENLIQASSLTGLGKPGETIQAVRFFGKKGYVVTYQQIDPLYTLDLTDPLAPSKAGELEVPGFSTYLHPISDDRLLAIGQAQEGGIQLSLFDVSDFQNPSLVNSVSLGAGSYSEAQYEHKAFNYFEPLKMLAIPVTAWSIASSTAGASALGGDESSVSTGPADTDSTATDQTGTDSTDTAGDVEITLDQYEMFNGMYLYHVDPLEGFTYKGSIDHTDFYKDEVNNLWYMPEGIRRSMFIGENDVYHIYSISGRGVMVNPVSDLSQTEAIVPLPQEEVKYWYEYDIGILKFCKNNFWKGLDRVLMCG